MASVHIFSNRCWINQKLIAGTVVVEGEKITAFHEGKSLDGADLFIDASDEVVMPGVIDAHVHINEPGRTNWEGFETATNAAAAGGTTTMIEMPLNSSPVVTNAISLKKKLDSSSGKLRVNCGFYGGVVPGNSNELNELVDGGIWGLKSFLIDSGLEDFPPCTKEDVTAALETVKDERVPFLFHCEIDDGLNHQKDLEENPGSFQAFLKSRPPSLENNAIDLIIDLCQKYNRSLHIVHLSSSESLRNIKKAKSDGLAVSVETCPHYLLFNSENIKDYDTRFKCTPPIREAKNNRLLIEAIANGEIDFLTTDHSPCIPELKEYESGNILKAWGGISGLQFLLSASWTALKAKIGLETFIPLLTESPARFLGINNRKGTIKAGYDADLVIWNPESSQFVNEDGIFHRHKTSPYVGMDLYGKVRTTIVNGVIVFDDGELTSNIAGKVLLRNESKYQ